MTFKPFETHTGLLIHVDEDEGEFVVGITGDRVKELLRTPDEASAIKEAEGLKAHYVEREKTDPKDKP